MRGPGSPGSGADGVQQGIEILGSWETLNISWSM